MFFYVSTLFQPLPAHKQFTTPPLSHLSFPFPSLHSRHRPISTPVPLCHTHSSSTISSIASFIRIPLSSNPLPYNVIDWRLFLFRSSPVSPRSSRIPIRFDLIRSRLSLVNIVSYSSGCCAGAFSFSRQYIYTSGALISPHAVLAVPERYAFIIALRFFKSFIDNVQL